MVSADKGHEFCMLWQGKLINHPCDINWPSSCCLQQLSQCNISKYIGPQFPGFSASIDSFFSSQSILGFIVSLIGGAVSRKDCFWYISSEYLLQPYGDQKEGWSFRDQELSLEESGRSCPLWLVDD